MKINLSESVSLALQALNRTLDLVFKEPCSALDIQITNVSREDIRVGADRVLFFTCNVITQRGKKHTKIKARVTVRKGKDMWTVQDSCVCPISTAKKDDEVWHVYWWWGDYTHMGRFGTPGLVRGR